MKKINIIILATSLLFSLKAFSMQFHNIKKVSNSVGSKVNFNILSYYDFNNDGKADKVSCSKNEFVRIKNGINNKTIYTWKGPDKYRDFKNGWVWKLNFSGCEIVKMPGSRPIIILSNFWDTFRNGKHFWRARAWQWIIFHDGTRYRVKALRFGNKNEPYASVARSVKCKEFPKKLVTQKIKPGALCFFSDYAADNYNRSALFKLERSNNGKSIIAKDLTPTALADSPWKNGAKGTNIYSMPLGAGWKTNQRDGGFMMDAALNDFNHDGLIDIFTVGQHASLRAHIMVYDRSKPEGIRFKTQALTSARKGIDPTELLRVNSLARHSLNATSSCVYLSSEKNEGKVGRDEIRCLSHKGWSTYNLPQAFRSDMHNARARWVPKLGLIIKTGFRRKNNNKFIPLTFRVPYGKLVIGPTTTAVTPVVCRAPYIKSGNSCVYDHSYDR